jgi:hypothetical protein
MNRLETEFKRALVDYVQRTPLADLREICKAAEEWFGGGGLMRQFARNNGILETGADYKAMSEEVFEALNETTAQEPWRASLLKLQSFGMRIHYIDQRLRKIGDLSAQLAVAGLPDHYVTGVVAYSLEDGRRAA